MRAICLADPGVQLFQLASNTRNIECVADRRSGDPVLRMINRR